MLWDLYLFVVFYTPKLIKALGVGVFGGAFLGLCLSTISLIVTWVWPGATYIYSDAQLHEWGFLE